MKITVELSDNEVKDVMRFTGEKKKGPALRKLIVNELMLRRRREMSRKALAGEWSAELPSMEKLRQDRKL